MKSSEYYKSEKFLKNCKDANIESVKKIKKLKNERIKKYNEYPKLCLECNNPIDYEKRINKFCSSSCSASFNNKKRRLTEVTKNKISKSLKKGSIVIKECEFCKKEFTVEWSVRNQKFCCVSCASKDRFKNKKIKPKKIEHLKYVKKICEYCQNEYDAIWKYRNRQKYCCTSCSAKGSMSKEIKEKLSEFMSNKIKDGTFKPKLKSIKCLYKFKNKKIRCDSKVEYSCLNYFENNFDVINIERCDFLLNFDYSGVTKKYNPDFKITTIDNIYIVECKTILSSKELVRKWSYYYDTIEYKKASLYDYCKNNGFLDFNYNKSLNYKFYKNCKPELM